MHQTILQISEDIMSISMILPLTYMSKLTHNLLGTIDYGNVVSKCNENWKLLHDALGDKNKLYLDTPVGPYMYPFYCESRVQVKKALADIKKLIPTLWLYVLDFDGCELEMNSVKSSLPLPINQSMILST